MQDNHDQGGLSMRPDLAAMHRRYGLGEDVLAQSFSEAAGMHRRYAAEDDG